MKRAFVFPGQGSQAVGMGKDLNKAFIEAKEVFQEIDDAISLSLSKLMFEGPDSELMLTENAQVAIMAVSIAAIRIIERQGNLKISEVADFVAGHSLGEYSALAASRSIPLSETASLLRKRGKSMQNAVPLGEGAMVALIGSSFEDVQALIGQSKLKGEICSIANDNAPGQLVVSGNKKSVLNTIDKSKDFGVKKAVLLAVSAPFHCSLMEPAKNVMKDEIEKVKFYNLELPIVTNISAQQEEDTDKIKQLLIEQITGMVRWRESITNLYHNGVGEIIEIGAGKVLSGLNKRINKEITSRNIENVQDIDNFLESL
ncbi:MAG: ACP S-malonyltransferase [Pseudomonadota bacterium]|nr:ACP S-malonyltransferase [Pseudomonadota bacterium]